MNVTHLPRVVSKSDLSYKTEKDEYCAVTFMKHYIVGDEDIESLFVDLLRESLQDPYQLLRYSTTCALFELIAYCLDSIKLNPDVPAFPLKVLFWLYGQAEELEVPDVFDNVVDLPWHLALVSLQTSILYSAKLNAARSS
ncbi:hypothetical protein HDU97_005986 [Phlyctochytrium planicorne]|nr:hypothetical protein HDU97_005986 [Phlyctochytrium planicorne]